MYVAQKPLSAKKNCVFFFLLREEFFVCSTKTHLFTYAYTYPQANINIHLKKKYTPYLINLFKSERNLIKSKRASNAKKKLFKGETKPFKTYSKRPTKEHPKANIKNRQKNYSKKTKPYKTYSKRPTKERPQANPSPHAVASSASLPPRVAGREPLRGDGAPSAASRARLARCLPAGHMERHGLPG